MLEKPSHPSPEKAVVIGCLTPGPFILEKRGQHQVAKVGSRVSKVKAEPVYCHFGMSQVLTQSWHPKLASRVFLGDTSSSASSEELLITMVCRVGVCRENSPAREGMLSTSKARISGVALAGTQSAFSG